MKPGSIVSCGHVRPFGQRALGRTASRPASSVTGSARTSSTRRATCIWSSSCRRRTPTRLSPARSRTSSTGVSGRASSSRRTRRGSSRTGSACTWHVMQLLAVVAAGDFTIEEIDAITGTLIGRPKSATFRTMDLAGLDILAAVATDLATRLPDASDRSTFVLPPFVAEMIGRGLVGEKAGHWLLSAGAHRRRRLLDSDARPGDIRISRAPSAAPAGIGGGPANHGPRRAPAMALHRRASDRRSPAARGSSDVASTRP